MHYELPNNKILEMIDEQENVFSDFISKGMLPLGIYESGDTIKVDGTASQVFRDGTMIFVTSFIHFSVVGKTLAMFEQCKTGYHLEIKITDEEIFGGILQFIVKKNIEVDTTALENQKKILEECKKLQDIQFDLVTLKEKYQKYTKDLANHENTLFSLEEMVKDMVKDEEKRKLALGKIKELNNELDELEATIKQDIPSVDKSMDITAYLEKELKKGDTL